MLCQLFYGWASPSQMALVFASWRCVWRRLRVVVTSAQQRNEKKRTSRKWSWKKDRWSHQKFPRCFNTLNCFCFQLSFCCLTFAFSSFYLQIFLPSLHLNSLHFWQLNHVNFFSSASEFYGYSGPLPEEPCLNTASSDEIIDFTLLNLHSVLYIN